MYCRPAARRPAADRPTAREKSLSSPVFCSGKTRIHSAAPFASDQTSRQLDLVPIMFSPSTAPAPETEVAIALRRVTQAEANVPQAEARVLHQFSVVQAIAAKLPKEQHVDELHIAQAALEFAKAAHARAIKVCLPLEAELSEAKRKAAAVIATSIVSADWEWKSSRASSSESAQTDAARKASSIGSRFKMSNKVWWKRVF